MARIAITGGTGFVGIHTSRALAAAGHELRLLARGTRSGPRPAGAEWVRADVVEATGLVEALQGCDAVVNLVAIIREKGEQTFARVNAQGTANVVRAATEAGVGHLVHISAIGVDPDPRYPYLASKWEGEQAVRSGRVPFTVLRPSLIFGPGDGFFTMLAKLIRLNPVVPVVGDGRALLQPIAIGDLARIITLCIERGPDGRVHEVGGPEHLTYEQIIDVIKVETGRHRRNVHVPVGAMVPLATVMEKVLPNPPVTPGQLRMLERENVTRLDAVASQFGFEPIPLEGHAAYLQDY
ncbi:MAG TPA: complex I NDUFA9 subunit family protein [Candidatus Dormibacteraeota bacterium]|nr:complex I NDUFA9 subunit family protein [Candidatus Dormibacteraeota bacterium]